MEISRYCPAIGSRLQASVGFEEYLLLVDAVRFYSSSAISRMQKNFTDPKPTNGLLVPPHASIVVNFRLGCKNLKSYHSTSSWRFPRWSFDLSHWSWWKTKALLCRNFTCCGQNSPDWWQGLTQISPIENWLFAIKTKVLRSAFLIFMTIFSPKFLKAFFACLGCVLVIKSGSW